MDPRLDVRYVVIKLKDLSPYQKHHLAHFMREFDVYSVGCVVVEEDWPEYQPTVDAILARVNGNE